MATIYKIQTLLRTDGTNQNQRRPAFLSPASVAIEDRDLSDLVDFAYRMAAQLRYYDEQDVENGNWSVFFEELLDGTSGQVKSLASLEQELSRRDNMAPHLALFITFLQLLEYQKVDINKLTKAHLDYYYGEILKIKTKPAQPDTVHVVFELAKGKPSFLLKAGTPLDGGTDAQGTPLTYQTTRDLVINRAAIQSLQSVFIERRLSGTSIFSATVANSEDGMGAPLLEPNDGWLAFGESQDEKGTDERNMIDAQLGFAIASPQLFLKEGHRTIVTNIVLESTADTPPVLSLSGDIEVFYSSEEGWTPIDLMVAEVFEETSVTQPPTAPNWPTVQPFTTQKLITAGSSSGQGYQDLSGPPQERIRYQSGPIPEVRVRTYQRQTTNNQLAFTGNTEPIIEEKRVLSLALILPESAPAMLAYDEALHEGNYATRWPVLRVMLKKNSRSYQNLSQYIFRTAEVDTYVQGVRDLVLQNDTLPLDNSGPFLPFGAQPRLGSTFYIGSAEVFQKKLSHLEVQWSWKDAPSLFSEYYQASYGAAEGTGIIYGSVNNASFDFEFSYLYQKQWLDRFTRIDSLFNVADATLPQSKTFQNTVFAPFATEINYQRLPALQSVGRFNRAGTKNGFVRMVLQGVNDEEAAFTAFGHREAPRIYSQQAIALSRFTVDGGEGEEPPLPNPPYTPEMERLSINYASVQPLELEQEIDAFFTIGPFGNKKIRPSTNEPIVPLYTEEATLYIGLEGLEPPQTVNFLFKLAEGTGSKTQVPGAFRWSILAQNQWLDLSPAAILIDSTNQFQRSGIVSIALSRAMTNQNSLMPAGQHWLKVSVATNSAGINRFISVQTQAVDANLVLSADAAPTLSEHLNKKLAATTITKLVERKAAIKKITQPYPSFDGRPIEDAENYYTRTSEYLRHKNRAITIWDYERLILEEFPSIFKVKCLNHTRPDGLMAPGHITAIVVSNQKNNSLANPLQPSISEVLLQDIKDFLLPHTSFFIQQNPNRLTIENPLYEQLLLDFKVAFLPKLDVGFYRNLLNEELKKFLSPWAFDEGQDIEFGGMIHRSDLMAFVESRPYV
ncbi:MAG: hypothetical protein AAF798_21755, partial [Bacteroidota bacterium]